MIKKIKVGKITIGDDCPTFIVAEIGLNHNGSIKQAKRLIKAAKEAGAHAVKFQKRDLKSLYKTDLLKNPNKDSQTTAYLFDIFKRFELTDKEFIELKKYCEHLGIIFFASAFDLKSAEFLGKINIPLLKIASADLTNMPLFKTIIKFKKPILLSTGMSQLPEIDYSYNYLIKNQSIFALLHCVGAYPPPFKDINLKMIPYLRERYQVQIGYSGHERGIIISIAAVSLGAKIIERHLTLNRSWEGPDHNISLTPLGFRKMVDRIKVIELALGQNVKTLSRGEYLTRETFAKSLIAKRNIKLGEIIKPEMIDIKSPGKGLSAQKIDLIVGSKAKRTIEKNDYFYELDLP